MLKFARIEASFASVFKQAERLVNFLRSRKRGFDEVCAYQPGAVGKITPVVRPATAPRW